MLLTACTARALGPHEVLVLVNRKSADSVAIADAFVQRRGVPDSNVVHLDLPKRLSAAALEISPEDFTRYIWAPGTQAVQERQIGDHILAWVYSAGFPVRVMTTPPVSITGLTFLRNRMPILETLPLPSDVAQKYQGQAVPPAVRLGMYASPIYAGPDAPGQRAYYAQSLDRMREGEWLGTDMPLPAMMLGYTGERGNTREEVLACLRRGAEADHTDPRGMIYLLTGTNVRALARSWQFPGVQSELAAAGVTVALTNAFPVHQRGVMGVMAGSDVVNPALVSSYLPGAVADHLTSHGASFDYPHQTKISAWIRAGATATAGTVSEPRAIWTKFVHARYFTHYRAGCTVLESFYQALRCPLQILLLGDPLAQPWAPRGTISLHGLDNEAVSGRVRLTVQTQAEGPPGYGHFVFLVDGCRVAGPQKEPVYPLNASMLTDGPHVLRVVAYREGLVRSQAFDEKSFAVRGGRPGRRGWRLPWRKR
ncbi:MAG: TIGR03790 family protein [Kiritimatiellae bacterium]|nr:TIGR03790 family protein [Kiritimatiellia bacterium]